MLDELRRLVGDLRALLGRLEPELIHGDDAARLLEEFVQAKRLCAAGETLLAARAADTGVWQRAGHRSAASWLASRTGTGLGAASEVLQAGARLEHLEATKEALAAGELSEAQLQVIASGAAGAPEAEAELLGAARREGLAALRDRSRRIRAATRRQADALARYEAVCRRRFFRHWSDGDGALRGEFSLAPLAGAKLLAAISTEADRLVRDARKAGRQEPPHAYRADALVALVTGGSPGTPGASVALRVDLAALRRGELAEGEVCDIPGVGPVPLAVARDVLGDATVQLVVADAVDVASVCHLGRTVPAHLRSALEARDPTCVVPGCDVAQGLEIDHCHVPFAEGGPASLDNTARLCAFHHHLKTYRGYRLTGAPGRWSWEGPAAPRAGAEPAPLPGESEAEDSGEPTDRLATLFAGP